MQAVQGFLQRNPAYLQGRDPQQVMAMLMAGDALPMEAPPVTVSPGSPAPVQPGVQIDAPAPVAAPVADYRNQDALRQNMSPAEDIIRRARESAAQRVEQAEAGAEVPAEIAEVLRRRETRAEGDLEASEKERKQAMWLAVAMAGAKMASSQSPYFMAALAEGLDAGLQGFSKAKAEAAERKASILDRQEQAVLDRYQVLVGERDRAVARMQAGEKLAKDEVDLINSGEDQIMARAKHDLDMRKGEEDLKAAPLERRLIEAQIGAQQASAAASRARAAGVGRGSGEGGGSGGEREIPRGEYDLFEGAMQRAQRFEDLAAEAATEGEKSRLLESARQTRASANKRLLQAERRAGYPVGGGSATPPPSAAPAAARAAASNVAPKAQFQYVPGKGMVPVT
jgi:hypothetical protein